MKTAILTALVLFGTLAIAMANDDATHLVKRGDDGGHLVERRAIATQQSTTTTQALVKRSTAAGAAGAPGAPGSAGNAGSARAGPPGQRRRNLRRFRGRNGQRNGIQNGRPSPASGGSR